MRKYYLPISLLILTAICFVPMHGVFADSLITGDETSIVTTAFSYLIKFASRGWMILAFLAGKLMSNDWIYASGLHIDKVLFTMWNYMKNIANFMLGFLLVAGILKSLFTKNAFNLKTELPKFLLAGVLINMSWFLMGTLLDVSNLATAAVGAFPQALLGDNIVKDQQIKQLDVSIPDRIEVHMNENNDVKTYTGGLRKLDSVRGRFNDMSGPLLFLGSSILRIQDLPDLNPNITSFKSFTSAQIIKIIIVLMFIAPLAALFVINLQRIFYLWLWIIFSPLIILMDDSIIKLGKFDLGKMKDKFSFKAIIGMIFAPVMIIGGMALVLIMSTGMYYVLGGKPGQSASATQQTFSYGGADIVSTSTQSTLSNPTQGSDIIFEGDLFRDAATYAGGFVGYIIIVGFTIMLLWTIVKMSLSTSSMAGAIYKKITDLGGSLASSLPIVPIGGKSFSLGAAQNLGKNSVDNIGSGLKQKFLEYDQKNGIKQTFYQSDFGKSFKRGFNIPDEELRDLTLKQANILADELKGKESNSLTGFGNIINKFVKANANTTFTTKSKEFMNTITKTLRNTENKQLKQDVVNALHITDAEYDTALFETNTQTGQKFFTLLQDMINKEDADHLDLNKYKTLIVKPSNDTIVLHSPKAPETPTNN